jgi:hypothetical protein
MNRKPSPRQLALFPAELPTWESLPQDRQQDLQEVLSLLLEQMLPQQAHPPVDHPQKHAEEEPHV